MSNKLRNIEAIQKMLRGEHFTQTRLTKGFSDAEKVAEKNKKREVGEIWEEYDEEGNVKAIWEQKEGYRVKSSRAKKAIDELRVYLNSYPNCLEDCRTKSKNKLDRRFRNKFGRCADCQFRIESLMKNNGSYKEYERKLMLENAKAFFKQADTEIEIVADQIKNEHAYVNVDGKKEKWEGSPGMAKQLVSEYNEYKKIVLDKLSEEEHA